MNEKPGAAPAGAIKGQALIAGKWLDKAERFPSLNPATGELLGYAPKCDAEDVASAVKAAREAFPSWAQKPLQERLDFLDLLANLIHKEADSLASLITYENGKPLQESFTIDVMESLDLISGICATAPGVLRPKRAPMRNPLFFGKRHRIYHLPLGVVAVISPWNLPLSIPVGQLAMALAAGNTVVFKPSELTPLVGVKLATLFERAGFPAGVFNLVTGGGDAGKALVESDISGVLFTGSTATGVAIHQSLAGRFVPAQMELGGKDAFLLLADANLERAINGALWNGCAGSGQLCSSTERIFVPRPLLEAFANGIADKARSLLVGSGLDPLVQLGPLISEAQRAKGHAQGEEAKSKGARILCGGALPPGPGFFYPPTVMVDVPLDCALMRDETFGPVLPIAAYDDVEEAVAWCNDTPYGLSASVWTSDTRRGEALAARLNVGSVWINDASYTHAQVECPWGGVKASGVGRTNWKGSLEELTTLKLIGVTSGSRRRELWWFPYGHHSLEMVRAFRSLLWDRGLRRLEAAGRAVRHFLHLGRDS
ncbi:MAG: aldehyde dehydrogenase [Acidobacteria bacterium]|nr:aldehyde dehydrogenase [Acidobacteriota bacterium]